MTTRASFKCYLSGITLNVDEAIVIESHVICKRLSDAWTTTYGPLKFNTDTICPETLYATSGPNTHQSTTAHAVDENDVRITLNHLPLQMRQHAFIISEINSLMNRFLLHDELSQHFTYFKVLIGFLLSIDSRSCLETLAKAINACEQSDMVAHLDPVSTMMKSVTANMLTLPAARVVSELDDLRCDAYESLEVSTILVDLLLNY